MSTTDNTQLSFIIEDTTYPFWDGTIMFTSTDGTTYLYYIADNGLGMAPVTRITQRGPFQHGDSDVDYRLEPRTISYIFGIFAPSLADLETARELLLRLFRPSNTPFIIQYERSNGALRQTYGHFTGGMQFASTEREQGSWFQRFSVDVRCADPTFFDPFEESVSFTSEVLDSAGLSIPLSIPLNIRGDTLSVAQNVFYNGSAEAYPVITLYGPMLHPSIINDTTGDELSFDATSVPANGYYIIDLRVGYKTVVDQDGISRVNELSDESNISGWSLPVSRLPQQITLAADYIGVQFEIARIAWNTRYVGI